MYYYMPFHAKEVRPSSPGTFGLSYVHSTYIILPFREGFDSNIRDHVKRLICVRLSIQLEGNVCLRMSTEVVDVYSLEGTYCESNWVTARWSRSFEGFIFNIPVA